MKYVDFKLVPEKESLNPSKLSQPASLCTDVEMSYQLMPSLVYELVPIQTSWGSGI